MKIIISLISLSSEYGMSHLPTSHIAVSPSRKEEVKEGDAEKEAAVEAELKAARDRAVVPLEARLNQFKDMLLERGVKHFNAIL